MRPTLACSLLLLVVLVAPAVAQTPAGRPAPPPPAIKEGQPAPDFTLTYLAGTGEARPQPHTVRLSDFRGKQPVVLAFFPAAFSPG